MDYFFDTLPQSRTECTSGMEGIMNTEFLDKLMNKWVAMALIVALFAVWCLHFRYVALPRVVGTVVDRSERINRAEPQQQKETVPARYAYPRDKLTRI